MSCLEMFEASYLEEGTAVVVVVVRELVCP